MHQVLYAIQLFVAYVVLAYVISISANFQNILNAILNYLLIYKFTFVLQSCGCFGGLLLLCVRICCETRFD